MDWHSSASALTTLTVSTFALSYLLAPMRLNPLGFKPIGVSTHFRYNPYGSMLPTGWEVGSYSARTFIDPEYGRKSQGSISAVHVCSLRNCSRGSIVRTHEPSCVRTYRILAGPAHSAQLVEVGPKADGNVDRSVLEKCCFIRSHRKESGVTNRSTSLTVAQTVLREPPGRGGLPDRSDREAGRCR